MKINGEKLKQAILDQIDNSTPVFHFEMTRKTFDMLALLTDSRGNYLTVYSNRMNNFLNLNVIINDNDLSDGDIWIVDQHGNEHGAIMVDHFRESDQSVQLEPSILDAIAGMKQAVDKLNASFSRYKSK